MSDNKKEDLITPVFLTDAPSSSLPVCLALTLVLWPQITPGGNHSRGSKVLCGIYSVSSYFECSVALTCIVTFKAVAIQYIKAQLVCT